MTIFHELLRVQDHDTAADRLRHRRASLPELAQLAAVENALVRLAASLTEVGGRRDEAARRQRRLEDQLAAVEVKIAELERRLYSGTVTVPRELQSMQAELDALRHRRATLEDAVLEAMGDREPLDEEVAAMEGEQGRLDQEGSRLRAAIAESQADIDAELATELAARDEAAATLPAQLTTMYERLRTRHGGVGAAPLVNGRCGGCHLALSATELDRLKRLPADALVACEQCGRVLVRP